MSRSLAGGAGRVDWCPEQQALISWVRSSLCQKHGRMEANTQHSHYHTESKKLEVVNMVLNFHAFTSYLILLFLIIKIYML